MLSFCCRPGDCFTGFAAPVSPPAPAACHFGSSSPRATNLWNPRVVDCLPRSDTCVPTKCDTICHVMPWLVQRNAQRTIRSYAFTAPLVIANYGLIGVSGDVLTYPSLGANPDPSGVSTGEPCKLQQKPRCL